MTATDDSGATTVLSIEGEMTIYRAHELKKALLDTLDRSAATCDLDLSGVTDLDCAGVQLLMLVRQLSELRAQAVRVVAFSLAVQEVLALFNLASYLDAPPPPPPDDSPPAEADLAEVLHES